MDNYSRKEIGFLAENIAARYLQDRGYEVIDRNFRRPWGEIDIIAKKNGAFIFVEVKANSKTYIGDFDPEVRVNPEKMTKIIKTASLFMNNLKNSSPVEWQIDVVSVNFDRENKKARIRHIKNVGEDFS